MTDWELMALDQDGFVPGPGEDENSFLTRVERVKKNFLEGNWIPESHWSWVREYLGGLFNVKPLYICAFYSNKNLAPWQGAASWIEGRALHSIQLREGMRKGRYLGIYSREEILAHEAVHAARSGFEESRFEEFFAYMTAEKRWRRVLGPLVRRPWEIYPFLIGALAGAVWPACYLLCALWAGIGFWRLIRGHLCLSRAAKRLANPRAVLFRLTDREIEALAKGLDIENYAKGQTCLRWRIIRMYLRGAYG
jgi:hypothetical protein